MQQEQLDNLTNKGIDALEKGYIQSAQVLLGQVAEQHNTPVVRSYLAYCAAKSQGRVQEAMKICRESIRNDPKDPAQFLLLGRLYLMVNEKEKAMLAFREGIRVGSDPRILAEMNKLGQRKPAVIPSLKRSHPLNRLLGKLFARLGLR
jgi:uncharacterized protein HemY